jgi:hypothetical protein
MHVTLDEGGWAGGKQRVCVGPKRQRRYSIGVITPARRREKEQGERV